MLSSTTSSPGQMGSSTSTSLESSAKIVVAHNNLWVVGLATHLEPSAAL